MEKRRLSKVIVAVKRVKNDEHNPLNLALANLQDCLVSFSGSLLSYLIHHCYFKFVLRPRRCFSFNLLFPYLLYYAIVFFLFILFFVVIFTLFCNSL